MMRLRILLYACVFVFSETHTAITKDSDEQSMLQEALLLVDLLKSEYSRVLRENNIIKKSKIDEKDLQTCATTDDATHVQTDKERHTEQSRTTETLMPYTVQGSRRSYHPGYFPRRRFVNYPDYYGNYGPAKYWRRMDYDNIFGPQPNHTLSTTTVGQSTVSVTNSQTDVTLSSIVNTPPVSDIPTSSTLLDTSSSSTVDLSTTASTSPKPVTISLTTSKPTELSIPTISPPTTPHPPPPTTPHPPPPTTPHPPPPTTPPISSTTSSFTSSSTLPTTLLNKIQPTVSKSVSTAVNTLKDEKAQTEKKSVSEKVKKLHLSVNKTTVTSTNEPEQAQVAAELENELEAGIQSSSFSPFSRRGPIKWRASTRVHLAKSTPYYLPLPENHAFCYTNPKSSLCRTFIK